MQSRSSSNWVSLVIKTVACAVYFDKEGDCTELACMAFDEHRRSVLGVQPLSLTHLKTVEEHRIAGALQFWIDKYFTETQTANLEKEYEIAWIFFSYEEKRFVDGLLGGELHKYSDDQRSCVLKEIMNFVNLQTRAVSQRYKTDSFWLLMSQFRYRHDYKLQDASQQAYLIPAMLGEMNARIHATPKQ